nr:sigma 54-interacting transcriptional regulator [Sedimentibacter sp.]
MEYYDEQNILVSDWMKKDLQCLSYEATIGEALDLFLEHDIYSIPIVSNTNQLLGLVSQSLLLKEYFKGNSKETPINSIMDQNPATLRPNDYILKVREVVKGAMPVIDHEGILVGIITSTDILRAYFKYVLQVKKKINSADTLKLVMNIAYEGVVVIDSNCIILEFNEAYGRFINKRPEEVIGKNVCDIIENTRLHIVVKNGIEERGRIQRISGHDMVVHRIPIKDGDNVIGAIGMLIFEDVNELYNIIGRAQRKKEREKFTIYEMTPQEEFHLGKIIGDSPVMLEAKNIAKKAARTPSTVLITGDSGTGKELFAQAIHDMSLYSEGQLISVNCSAIPEGLLEAELFGYEEGAFTDARKGGKKGKFELAHNGTIFLDEIGDMPHFMQAKILRVLQDRTIEPVGGVQKSKVNVRIIAATNRNLEKMIIEGTFREDLYYRLNIIRLELPSLKDRVEDIPKLMNRFIRKYCSEFGFPQKTVSEEAMTLLMHYNWPGNVREVLNIAEMLVSMTDGNIITPDDLPEKFKLSNEHRTIFTGRNNNHVPKLKNMVVEEEIQIILDTIAACGGNKSAAARKLGIQRSTLYAKLEKLGM